MRSVQTFWRRLLRFLIVWFVDTLSLLATAALIPGITLNGADWTQRLIAASSAAIVLGIVNFLFRPLIMLFSLPFGMIVVLVAGLLVNAIVLMITSWLMPSFDVTTLLAAILGGIIFSVVNTLLTGVLSLDEEDSYYFNRILKRAKQTPYPDANSGTKGLVMLEIDGLSYWHIQKALADGWMPHLKSWLDSGEYALTRADCGLPSQTSACQAGIMFGDNTDIPAFRWYDKTEKRLIVSGSDAAMLNARYAQGKGLMRDGTSINNMLNGDAKKSLLTVADLRSGAPEEKKARAHDIYLLMLDPYFMMRSLVLFFVDVGRDLWEGWQQKRQDVYPRLNRTKHFYPFVRAAMVTLMREISSNLVILDIVRGSPSIYMTYPGYDEVAHHSGPWTTDAFKVLKKFDRTIAHVRNIADTQAPRPYDVLVLSDHGQSFGPTFLMRYGKDIRTTVEELMPAGTSVGASIGGDTGVNSMTALGNEMANVGEQGVGNAAGRAVASQTKKLTERAAANQNQSEVTSINADKAQVVAYGSGNIAQVYFKDFPTKMKATELRATFPGMIEGLIAHEGVGFVVVNEDDGTAIVIGKTGTHNVHTGAITGVDPLLPYTKAGVATSELRAEQLRRIADFPHAGDMMINSTVYPDGSVAALEELIGCHGGMGGEQMDAFVLHPKEWEVPATKNSADLFGILNAQRGLPAQPRVVQSAEAGVNGWAPAAMAKGLSEVGLWIRRAGRALLLEAGAYREIAQDAYMNAPAVLIALVFSASSSLGRMRQFDPLNMLGAFFGWFVAVAVIFGGARALKGKGDFSSTVRVVGFAHVGNLLYLLAFFPAMAQISSLAATVVTFIGIWLGAAQAHDLKGWRSLLLPFVAILVTVISLFIIYILARGLGMTLDTFMQSIGISMPS